MTKRKTIEKKVKEEEEENDKEKMQVNGPEGRNYQGRNSWQ